MEIVGLCKFKEVLDLWGSGPTRLYRMHCASIDFGFGLMVSKIV